MIPAVIGIIVIVLIAVIFFNVKKNNEIKKEEEKKRLAKEKQEKEEAERKKREEEKRIALQEEEVAGKELYRYLNQSIKTMFQYYQEDQWDDLTSLREIELSDKKAATRLINKLSAANKKMAEDFFQCLDYTETFEGIGVIQDSERLKQFFLSTMLPFYPVYYKEFTKGPRYSSLLNQNILRLFTQLSGKKFRLGYKNRYSDGSIAFEWKEDTYQVYKNDGTLLCDASFMNGKVKTGYALLKLQDEETEDWSVSQKGQWEDGVLKNEDLQYTYKRQINPMIS